MFGRIAKAAGAPAPIVWAPGSEGQQMLISTSQTVFGRAAMPAYEISGSDVVFSFSTDILGTEQSPTRYGLEYGNFRTQPKGLRGQMVQFETRQSTTGSKADNWYPIRPGTDGLVALAIARLMADQPGVLPIAPGTPGRWPATSTSTTQLTLPRCPGRPWITWRRFSAPLNTRRQFPAPPWPRLLTAQMQ